MSFDRDLEMIRLKEREAFGWAMRYEASSKDQFVAANAWENYANTCKSLQDEAVDLGAYYERTGKAAEFIVLLLPEIASPVEGGQEAP